MGLIGLVGYAVIQRTREIAIRLATIEAGAEFVVRPSLHLDVIKALM